MLLAAVQAVECVRGCSQSEPSTPSTLAVLIALLGLMGTLIALKIAFASLRIARTQHEAFIKELSAEAELEISISFPHADAGVVETDSDAVDLLFSTTVKNVGDKIATGVEYTLYVPSDLSQLAWGVRPKSGDAHVKPPLLPNPDVLVASDGEKRAAKYLTRTEASVGIEVSVQEYAIGKVAAPNTPGSERRVPVRLEVFCHEMPGTRIAEAEIIIRRKAPEHDRERAPSQIALPPAGGPGED